MSDKIELIQHIGNNVCEGCGPDVDCGVDIAECERVQSSLFHLEKYLKPFVLDKERLDFLERNGEGWLCRNSSMGRGWRLHQTDSEGRCVTARRAISKAMEKQG